MNKVRLTCLALLSLFIPAVAQEDFNEIHKEDFARWAGETALAPADIHKMWRSLSHYANEGDDDSSIELLDIKALSYRRQILMSTSAGIPKCITVAVFSSEVHHQRLWQENLGPDSYGFCDNFGIPVKVSVSREGLIEVATAVYPDEQQPTRAVLREYSYGWDGGSYRWALTRDSFAPISPAARRSSR